MNNHFRTGPVLLGLISMAGLGAVSKQMPGMVGSRIAMVTDTVPASPTALADYLETGQYKSFAHETTKHASAGPHGGGVLAYMNPALSGSLAGGNALHPRQAAAVLERIDPADQILGWVVAVKTNVETDDGRGWFWYEGVQGTNGVDVREASWGAASCVSCHASGQDFVMTPYPFP